MANGQNFMKLIMNMCDHNMDLCINFVNMASIMHESLPLNRCESNKLHHN